MGDNKDQVVEGKVGGPPQRADYGALLLGGLSRQLVGLGGVVEAILQSALAPLADGLGADAIAPGEHAAELARAGMRWPARQKDARPSWRLLSSTARPCGLPAPTAQMRGYDAAKRSFGRKRRILVDAADVFLLAHIHVANLHASSGRITLSNVPKQVNCYIWSWYGPTAPMQALSRAGSGPGTAGVSRCRGTATAT